MKRALVTGVLGQDGSYLAEQLVDRGYSVVGVARPSGADRTHYLKGILDSEDRNRKLLFRLHYGDVTDPHLIVRFAQEQFDEVYLLAAQTHVMQSFLDPTYTMRCNAESPVAFFDAFLSYSPRTRIYFAGTSEMFGNIEPGTMATEGHAFEAHSPYSAAKVAAFLAARLYRKLGLFVVGGIGFNHESQRRGANFVTRKIGLGLRIFKETGQPLRLGNPRAVRDWHHAADTMRGAWLSLQHTEPDEYIFASGVPRNVQMLAEDLCNLHGVSFSDAVRFEDEEQKRPWEVDYLCGNPQKAEKILGWRREISYTDLLRDVSAE